MTKLEIEDIEQCYRKNIHFDKTIDSKYVNKVLTMVIYIMAVTEGKLTQRICESLPSIEKILYSYDYTKLPSEEQNLWQYIQEKLNYKIKFQIPQYSEFGDVEKKEIINNLVNSDYNKYWLTKGKYVPAYIDCYKSGRCNEISKIAQAIYKIHVYFRDNY